ncbi:insulinase family protein [Treponema sp.]|uniref:insulinase family protein n=1 Tax=Treponema sp. TaxID=166 RepID=UPI00388E88DF
MCNSLKKGDVYKSFEVLNVFDVPDYHSVAVHLRHLHNGLEIFHLLNDDSENLFAFAFRTPNKTSNGAAHIIEHSVLCGSEKYPVKDPFVILSNQSVKTYLNAMTYSDKTVYPASSIAKADYFNLFSVYGDAVFFPRLDKEIFMQEAYRLEVDENDNPSIQGVVYNEMKGSYSSFESVAFDYAIASLLPGSVYEKDSGGNPLEIPSLSYEGFLAFHKKWYRPDNCFLFLYGNIPTEEQIDFIDKNFVSRFDSKFSDYANTRELQKKNISDFVSLVKPAEITQPVDCYYEGPSGEGEKGNTVLVNWDIGRSDNALTLTEKVVLASVLCNHDGSPLQRVLMESGLGEDIAPQLGLFNSIYTSIITVGLRGVKKGNEKKIEELVLNTIKDLVQNGISKKDIDSTLMGMEYSQREIKRGHGPYSLSLMSRPIYGWLYGDGVENQIKLRSHLQEIRLKIENEPAYLKNLLNSLFLENKKRSLVVVTPSKKYTKNREKAEKELISQMLESKSKEEIKSDCEKLHLYQQKEDSPACLPHLKPADFIINGKPVMNRVATVIENLPSCDGGTIPFIKNIENTNGIVYLDMGFPVDVLNPELYPLLPLFSDCVTECGWKNLSWAQAADETALHTAGIGVNLLTMEQAQTEFSADLRKKYDWIGRDWLVFRMSMIEEESENAMNLLHDCITGVDFSDSKRIKDILTESENVFDSSVIPDGHIFVSSRVCAHRSKKSAVDEIWNGLSQYFTVKKVMSWKTEEIIARFKQIFAEVKAGGAFIHITAEQSGFDRLNKILPEFINKTKISRIKSAYQSSAEDFYNLIEENSSEMTNVFLTSSQVGYASQIIPASLYGTKQSISEEVCAHWLSNNLLWEKVRTIGGAYGVFCNTESMIGSLIFSSYRDPSPFTSCNIFEECLEKASQMDFSEEEVERAVMGCYSHFIQPQSPKGRGTSALTRLLYAVTDEDREQKILGILNMNPAELKKGFKNLYENCKNGDFKEKAVICGEKSAEINKNAGKVITLGV